MSDAETTVGVTGENAAIVADRIARDDVDVHVDAAAALVGSGVDAIVAVGEAAIADVVAGDPAVPVVPVDAGAGIRAVPIDDVGSLARELVAGDWGHEEHRPYSVTVDGESVGTAVFDATLVTTEAARISEYSVRVDGERLDAARADGVVVATPAGSTEYARRVEAPILAPGTGLAVAWIAPFRSDPDRWVVRPTSLSVGVVREDAAVDLLVDGEVVRTVGPDETVELTAGDPFTVAVFDASRDRHS